MRLFLLFDFLILCACVPGYSNLDDYIVENKIVVEEGHIGVPSHRAFFKNLFENNSWIHSIAETGFNAGHSAELFLSIKPDTVVTSFDLGSHGCVQKGYEYLTATYPKRINLILGDSKETVRKYASENPGMRFDLIFIDGGHDAETAFADIANMRAFAHRDTLLVLDDLWHIGEVYKAWDKAVGLGIINVIEIYQPSDAPGWGLARYANPPQAH
jgi:predicted O-methyltransferase YrrM